MLGYYRGTEVWTRIFHKLNNGCFDRLSYTTIPLHFVNVAFFLPGWFPVTPQSNKMGTSGSKHDAALVSWDASKVDVSFNKILTNSELTVGNREVVELSKQKRNGGIHIKENGPVTIQVPFEFAADLSDLKQLYEQFKSKKIFNLKPKVAKIITKGGDPGRSIIVEQADAGIRKEIRY